MEITQSTKITFPGGALTGTSKILLCKLLPSHKMIIVTEETPFHPLDHNWPDQPGDKGWITVDNVRCPVVDSLTAALNKETGEFLLDKAIKERKIRRDDSSWYFLVAHIIEQDLPHWAGKNSYLEVDANYRNNISKNHTACHLAAIALNKITKNFWNKPLDNPDSLGNPNFDAEAIISSKITEDASYDRYRCGKSLRKKGFEDSAFFAALQQVESDINKQLSEWTQHPNGIKILMKPSTAYLNDKREWHCTLPDGKHVKIPCGGTHIPSLSSPAKIVVTLKQEGEGEFTMISKLV